MADRLPEHAGPRTRPAVLAHRLSTECCDKIARYVEAGLTKFVCGQPAYPPT